MVLLSAATLLGLLLYDAVGPRLFVLRNVSASQPALVVVLALVLADVTRRLPVAPRRAATGLMLSLLAVTAVQSVGSANQRPAYRDAANYIDAVGGTDVIVEEPLGVRPRCATRPVHPQPVPPEVASPCRGRTGRRCAGDASGLAPRSSR